MTCRILITLEVEGDRGTAVAAVDAALDDGLLQDAINEYESDDGPVHVESALSQFAPDEAATVLENKNNAERAMQIAIEVSDKDIANTLCSAFEGGIAYWARIDSYCEPTLLAQPWGVGKCHPRYVSFPLSNGGAVQLSALDDCGDVIRTMPAKPLNRDTIAAGLKLMAEKYPRHFGDMLGETGDASTGDVLVQLAVFGEIVFG